MLVGHNFEPLLTNKRCPLSHSYRKNKFANNLRKLTKHGFFIFSLIKNFRHAIGMLGLTNKDSI